MFSPMAEAPSSITSRASSIDVLPRTRLRAATIAAPLAVSVIIPTLNEERLLPGLLADLAARRFRDFEVIVADARSRDRTCEIARSAPLGSLVIGSVSNGLDLMAQPAETECMVEGTLLLAAVTLDALACRGQTAAWR